MTPSEKAALLARINKAQSVGATILSQMSAAKRLVEGIPAVEREPDKAAPAPRGLAVDPYGHGTYGGAP